MNAAHRPPSPQRARTPGVSLSTIQLSTEDLRVLPPVVNVATAAAALGIGRSTAYDLIKAGSWPTPVLRLGKHIRIPSRELVRLIGLEP